MTPSSGPCSATSTRPQLGVTYAHEHLVIDGGRPVEMSPDFLLADVDRMAERARDARGAGLALGDRRDAVPTADATRRSSPSCPRGRACTSSRRPGSITSGSTGRRTGASGPPRTSWRTCSSPTSTRGSTSATTAARSSGGPRSGRGSSRSPAARAVRRPATADLPGGRRGPRPDRRPDPHPLRGGDRRARADPRSWSTRGVPAEHIVAQPRRQGRRPRLPPRALRDRRVRRLRPGVPLGRRAERHAAAAELGGRGRLLGPGHARDGRRAAGLLPRLRRVAGPDLPPRAVQRRDGRAWPGRRDPAAAVRRQSGPGVRVRGGSPHEPTSRC